MISKKQHQLRVIMQVNHQFTEQKQLYDEPTTFPHVFTTKHPIVQMKNL